MAVEIPVVVDIEGAFKDAARQVKEAIGPLQRQLSQDALKLRFKVDSSSSMSVKKLLTSTKVTTEQLEGALAAVEARINRLQSKGGFIPGNLTAREKDLLNIYTQLQYRINGTDNVLKKFTANMRSATSETGRLGQSLRGVIPFFSSFAAIGFASRFIKNVREVTSQFELQKVALGSIIQDAEYATSLFQRIKAAAIESPFQIKDLVTYTKQLSAYQIETDKLFDTTMKLADVSAGLGVDMGRLILAYGQVRAASVLRGQELRQFTEAGIPLVDKLAEKFTELNNRTVTTAEVFELISKRMVPFAMIDEIFDDMTSAGGMFYKMQEKQAETLAGQWSNLKDSVSIMYDEIGRTEAVHSAMTSLIGGAKDLMLNWRSVYEVVKVLGTALLAHVAVSKSVALWDGIVAAAERAAFAEESKREIGMRRFVTAIAGKTAAEKVSTFATRVHTAAVAAANATTNKFIATLWRLVAAMANNPFGLIVVALASAIGLLTTFTKKTKEASQAVADAEKSIKALNKTRTENEKLIATYEELSQKTSLNAKETNKLRDASKQLAKEFPKATEGINKQTGALELNLAKLKEYNQELKDALISGSEAEIRDNLKTIDMYDKRMAHIQTVMKRGYGFVQGSYYFGLSGDDKNMAKLKNQLLEIQANRESLLQANQDLQDAIDGKTKEGTKTKTEFPPIDEKGSNRLQKLRDQISDLTNAYKKYIELRQYESRDEAKRDIDILFPSLGGIEPTYEKMIERLNSMLNNYRGDVDATRIIEQAIANIKFDKIKSDFDDQLKKLSEELKRSEAARNFYEKILGLTGDQELAANITMSVYGGIGDDFKDRLRRELYTALKNSVSSGELSEALGDEFSGAIATMDLGYFRENLDKLPKNLRETFSKALNEAERFDAQWVENIMKTYEKTKTFEERMTDVRNREAENRQKIRSSTDIPEAEKERLLAASMTAEARDVAEIEVEAIKSTDEWISAFEDLDKVGTGTLRSLISMLEDLIGKGGADMNAGTLRALTKNLEQAREQVFRRNPFTGFKEGALAYADALRGAASARKALAEEDDPEIAAKLNQAESQRLKSLEKMKSSAEGLSSVFQELNSAVSAISEILSPDELSDTQAILSGIAKGIGFVSTSLALVNSILTLMEVNPIVLAISAAVAAAASLGAVLSNIKVNRANREIEKQSELIHDLEYQYGRLEKAIDKAFGSDYITNYNQQLDNLYAKQEAYMKQAEAERSKGKKADQDKIKEYENSAREAGDQLLEMQTQLSEFFTDTDLTSAAKDFANAWIEAYKEFGSTTDAMKERFQDMIQNMVEKSLAAKIMQELLQPIFDQIDILAKEGGELSVEDISAIARMANTALPNINDAMGTLMNTLAAAGYNIRQHPGQFSGISRNIANATEESISGLAAGINTQNYYMQYMPIISANVATIVSYLTGGAVEGSGATPITPTNSELTMKYLSALPTMDENLALLLSLVRSMVVPRSASPNSAQNFLVAKVV